MSSPSKASISPSKASLSEFLGKIKKLDQEITITNPKASEIGDPSEVDLIIIPSISAAKRLFKEDPIERELNEPEEVKMKENKNEKTEAQKTRGKNKKQNDKPASDIESKKKRITRKTRATSADQLLQKEAMKFTRKKANDKREGKVPEIFCPELNVRARKRRAIGVRPTKHVYPKKSKKH